MGVASPSAAILCSSYLKEMATAMETGVAVLRCIGCKYFDHANMACKRFKDGKQHMSVVKAWDLYCRGMLFLAVRLP